jgi:hypothetical protein
MLSSARTNWLLDGLVIESSTPSTLNAYRVLREAASEVYLERAFDEVRPAERFAVARELGETSLAFLVDPTLTDADIEHTCQAVEKVMTAAGSVA